jgi:hypothetical protein
MPTHAFRGHKDDIDLVQDDPFQFAYGADQGAGLNHSQACRQAGLNIVDNGDMAAASPR